MNDQLEQLAMKIGIASVYEEAKKQYNAMMSCRKHFFDPIDKVGRHKFKCRNCGVEVSALEKRFYEQGFQHAFDLMDRTEEGKTNE